MRTHPLRGAIVATAMICVGCLWACSSEKAPPDSEQAEKTVQSRPEPEPPPAINLEPFIEIARASDCTDEVNKLFVIDEKMVFWYRRGDCPNYQFTLQLCYDRPSDIICKFEDGPGGPKGTCEYPEERFLFSTISTNLEDPNLGLDPGRVRQVEF